MNVQSPIRGINSSTPRTKSRATRSGRRRTLLVALVLCLFAGGGGTWYLWPS